MKNTDHQNEKPSEELYEGTPIVVAGKRYIVPGLSFAQLENNKEDIDKIMKSKGNDFNMLKAIGKVVYLAMSRNYPDITREQVLEIMDIRNMKMFVDAAMGQSGFSTAEGKSSGE